MSTDSYQLKPGTVLDERYRIEKTIGEGGFGITYLGVSLHQGGKVAIKEFFWKSYMSRDQFGTSQVFLSREEDRKDYEHQMKRFLREARIIREFAGEPGIVQVRDCFEENKTAYIVMEFLEGQTLKQYLSEGKTMEPERAFRLLLPLMETLKKVHGYGMIHRDISPDNIMVNESGTLTLIDFGAARDYWKLDEETRSVILKGGYAACEQYDRHGRLGPWTDIYGLCAVLYFCITGHAPDDAFQRMLHDEQKSPKELGIRMDSGLEKVLMKGLSVEQTSRYQSMEDFIRAVREIVREKDPRELRKKWIRRGGILLACLLAVLGMGYWYYQRHLEQFKFRGQDTVHLAFSRPEDITDEGYQQMFDTLEERMDILAGENNYIIEEKEEKIRAVIPLNPCVRILEHEVSSYRGTEFSELLTYFLASEGRLYLDEFWLTSENVKEVAVKKGRVEGFTPDDMSTEEYYYLELKLTDSLARQLENTDAKRESPGVRLYLDQSRTGDGYAGAVNQASTIYDTEDYGTFFIVLTIQDPAFYELLVYDINHRPYEENFSGYYLPPAIWEETKTSVIAGEYQKDADEITDPAVYLEYGLSLYTDKELPSGQWYNTVSDFKTLLDTLEIPYAFGISKVREHDIVIKVPEEYFYPELMDMLTDKYVYVQDPDETVYEMIGDYNEKFQEKEHPYEWVLNYTNDYDMERIEQKTAEALQKKSHRLYLTIGDYIAAEAPLTESVKDGTFRFSDIKLDTSRIPAENVYRFISAVISDVTHDSSYEMKSVVFTEEKGEIDINGEVSPFRVLRRDRLETVRQTAAGTDGEIQVEDSLDMSRLNVILPGGKGEDFAVSAAETVKKLMEEDELLDGYYKSVFFSVQDDTLKPGEGLEFKFTLSPLSRYLTVELGSDWQEPYQAQLEAFFESDEFYRQFIDEEKFSFYVD